MMNIIYKILFVCIIVAGTAGIGYAQVDQQELQSNLAPVNFVNFEGPHARIESREQIRSIGVALGQAIKSGSASAGTAGRYFVIHSVSGADGTKLDADIFGLGVNAGVDHVRNLRLIIQGYLQEAYDYSESDAALLAEYITIYNAVYRGEWDYFSGRYKNAVIQQANARQAGLSTRYTEWPGNTLMLIPLGIGGLSAVDTSTISDSRVVEELRKEDDLGVEQRRDMVNLQEREAEAAEQRAAEQRESIRQEEQSITQEREQLQQEQQQIQEDRASGTITEQEAAQRETESRQRSQELDRREGELVLQREEAARQERLAEQRNEEAQQSRESIAQDQQTIIDRGEQPPSVIGIALERQGATLGRLLSLNPSTKEEVRRSPLDTVYMRTLTFINDKIIAIAGENRGNGAVRLIEINRQNLEMIRQGDDDLHPGSLIWVNGSDLYAITANLNDGTFNVGRFNTNLALQSKSSININPNASIHIQEGNLVTQRADGSAAILNPADLRER